MTKSRPFFIYLSVSVVSGLASVIISPLLSHHLKPEEFGVIGKFQVMVAFLACIIGGGHNLLIMKWYNKRRNNINPLISINLVFTITIALILLIVVSFYDKYYLGVFFGFSFYFILGAIITALFTALFSTLSAFFQISQQPKQWAISTLAGVFISLLVTLLGCYIFPHMAYEYRLLSFFSLNVTSYIIAFVIYRRQGNRLISYSSISRDVLKVTPGLIFLTLVTWGQAFYDRAIFSAKFSDAELGFYMFAVTLSMPVMMICTSMNRAFVPFIYPLIEDRESNKIIRLYTMIFFIYMFVCLIYSCISPLFWQLVINSKYERALSLIPFISTAFMLSSLNGSLMPFFISKNKELHITVIYLCYFVLLAFIAIFYPPSTVEALSLVVCFLLSVGFLSLIFFVSRFYGESEVERFQE